MSKLPRHHLDLANKPSITSITAFQNHQPHHTWDIHPQIDPSCTDKDLGRNPLFYGVQLINPSRKSASKLTNLLAGQHTRLHPRNLCFLINLIQ